MEVILRYWRFILSVGMACLLCLILIAKQQTYWQPEKPMKAINCQKFKISTIAFIEWNNLIKQEIVELGPRPPDVAQFTGLPGPKYYPARPFIEETYTSPGGLASVVNKGDDETMPVGLWIGETTRMIPLSEKPLSLIARSDGGVWMSTHQWLLFHYDRTGSVKHTVKLPGTDIVGVEGDAVWVMTNDKAWFVNANGDVRGSYPWEGFNRSVGSKQALCQLEGDKIRRVQCLDPDGKNYFVPLSLSKTPAGKLLFLSNDRILTGDIVGGNLGYYSSAGINAQLTIENAGLTPSGDAFVSIQTDDDRTEVCLSKGMGRRFSLKYNTPSLPIPLRLAVVAIEGERTLVYGFDRAVWYKGDQIENSFKVGDRRYRNEIFPYAWLPSIHFVTAKSNDGTVIISTTGPTGMALIGLRWNP